MTHQRALRAALALALLAALGCMSAGITVTQPPVNTDPPIPEAFPGTKEPALESTDAKGLLRAPEVNDHLYFYEPHALWYRYAYNRWYQAFAWNGNWFVPERVPDVLHGREPVRGWPGLMPLDPNMPVDEQGLPDPDGVKPGSRK